MRFEDFREKVALRLAPWLGVKSSTGIYSDNNVYVDGFGQVLQFIHDPKLCAGRPCVIHNPSDHSMREFPTLWRGDRRMFERVCGHGVGHPDPDYLEYVEYTFGQETARAEGVHGCDGCCHD